ncbi:hypothetical protein SISNIDRAFT_470881 [Sistotremastrum niveocremeum HHB9708]|uniref:Uncharacterized protein n=1 Tax=Sistotremastrum niveocremeum HHB9708 TaxID=1314777 RepID=A0A164NAM1_9AGAM|nr:hypothetical protein SISNIDRAFT_470881 [Sistotremastrum niveocremeum HHB9708]
MTSVKPFYRVTRDQIFPHGSTLEHIELLYEGDFEDRGEHVLLFNFIYPPLIPRMETLRLQGFQYMQYPEAYDYSNLRELILTDFRFSMSARDVYDALLLNQRLEVLEISSKGIKRPFPDDRPLSKGHICPRQLQRFTVVGWTYEDATHLFGAVSFVHSTAVKLTSVRFYDEPPEKLSFEFWHAHMRHANHLTVTSSTAFNFVFGLAGSEHAISNEFTLAYDAVDSDNTFPIPYIGLTCCSFERVTHVEFTGSDAPTMTSHDWRRASKYWTSLETILIGNGFRNLVRCLREDPRNLSTLRTLKVAKDKYLRNTNKVEPFEIIEMVIVRKKGGVRLTTFRLPGWNVFRNAKDPILGPHFVGLLRGYVDIVTVGAPGAALMS